MDAVNSKAEGRAWLEGLGGVIEDLFEGLGVLFLHVCDVPKTGLLPLTKVRFLPRLTKSTTSGACSAVLLSICSLGGLWPRRHCREQWLLDLLPHPTANAPVILAGHSWGGGAVARLAAAFPSRVSALVLVSPDVEWAIARRCWAIPTLLLWAKNDFVNPVLWTSRWAGHPNLTVHKTDKGGHNVLKEHARVIEQWLAAQKL